VIYLTQGSLEVNDSVIILEHVDLLDVLKGLNAYRAKKMVKKTEKQNSEEVAPADRARITYRTS